MLEPGTAVDGVLPAVFVSVTVQWLMIGLVIRAQSYKESAGKSLIVYTSRSFEQFKLVFSFDTCKFYVNKYESYEPIDIII